MYETDFEGEFSHGPLLSEEGETDAFGEFAAPEKPHEEVGEGLNDLYSDSEKSDDDSEDEEY